MKKVFKIILIVCAIFIIVACTMGIVDINRAHKNKEPIFSKNKSGGSVILYIGPGYVIEGAWDDQPGGMEYTKIHTWIYFLLENI